MGNRSYSSNSSEPRDLNTFKAGQKGIVIALEGDGEVQKQLMSMGIAIGCEVKMLINSRSRTLVAVNDARLAISPEAAKNIIVAAEPDEEPAISSAIDRLKQIWSLPH